MGWLLLTARAVRTPNWPTHVGGTRRWRADTPQPPARLQGAVPALAALLCATSDGEVRVRCLLALGMLAGGSPERQVQLADAPGAATQLVALMRQGADADCQQIAGGLFGELVSGDGGPGREGGTERAGGRAGARGGHGQCSDAGACKAATNCLLLEWPCELKSTGALLVPAGQEPSS